MAYIDPRANPTVGTEAVNQQVAGKALALLGILNQVTGTKGNSVREIEAIYYGQDPSQLGANLTLGAYDIEADYNAQAWETSQRVYFQSTPQRLALIQKKLQENLTKIQTDITSNIGKLFDIIEKNSDNGGLGIKAALDSGEDILSNSSGDAILVAGANLEQTIINQLTGDDPLNVDALDRIVDAFMAKFTLNIQRLDDEIFKLLDDKDDNFSNGSTDAAAAKYIVINKDSKAIIANNINDVFDAVFKTPYEADHGSSSWTSDTERTILNNFINNNFQKGSLNLSQGLINKIIEDKHISGDDLKKITKQSQFLEKYSFEEFTNLAASFYGTSGDHDATIKQLSLDHLEAITPKYFEDQRTLQDILTGKGNNSDTSNINRVFQSAGDQIKEAASGAIELLSSGFDKLSRNNFESFVRNNPVLAINHLETKKASLTNPQEIASVDNQIAKLIEFNKREVKSLIQWYTEKNKRLDKTNDADEIAHNTELLNVLQGPEGILSKLNSYKGSTSVSEIIELYNGSSELKLEELDFSKGEAFNDAALDKIISSGLKVQNVHAALYANEMLEAGKMNANHSNKELAKPNADGEFPEDKQITPPSISPTISSGIIAVIGNEILYKAKNLLNNPDVPNSTWVDKNIGILKDINNKLPTLADGTTAGKVFLDNLKEVFRKTIKDFVTSGVQSFKDSVDQARKAIDNNNTAIESKKLDINKSNHSIQIANNQMTLKTNQLAQLDPANSLDQNIANASSILPTLSKINSNELEKLEEDLASDDPKIVQGAIADIIKHINRDLVDLDKDIEHAQNKINKDQQDIKLLVDNKDTLLEDYKTKLKAYSDRLTDHFRDNTDLTNDVDGVVTTDIEQNFRNALVDTSLDLNKDGINDFQNIQNAIDKINELGDNVANVFGTDAAQSGDIHNQNIKRLILMMFAMSILEYSDWDYNKSEADLSKYAVTE